MASEAELTKRLQEILDTSDLNTTTTVRRKLEEHIFIDLSDKKVFIWCCLFQEERPVWHTINCNVLPKDHEEPKTEETNDRDEKIPMVTDLEYPPAFGTEDQAT
ncbi:hypothetical protein LIER_19493 [Lithospermum erythrorhizon]|uniref:DEK-C domain-containing protein n=1 Tax=Lithospermum erythrorhizon TaxID=34254 RepID=A0AAV3QKK2_LITER